MEFTIPQFIEKEGKLVGPLTLKQFVFAGAAVIICIIFFYTLPFPIFLVLAAVILTAGFSLAFLRINGLPFPIVVKNFFIFFLKPRVYLWEKQRSFQNVEYKKRKISQKQEKPKAYLQRQSNLKNLFTKLETKK